MMPRNRSAASPFPIVPLAARRGLVTRILLLVISAITLDGSQLLTSLRPLRPLA